MMVLEKKNIIERVRTDSESTFVTYRKYEEMSGCRATLGGQSSGDLR